MDHIISSMTSSSNNRFKSLLIAFALSFLLGVPVSAQLYVGLGAQVGYFNMSKANEATAFFNSKGYLFKSLREYHWPTGLRYAASYQEDRALLELSFGGKRHRTSTEFTNNNAVTRQDHRFGLSHFSATAGYAISESETMLLYLCGGLDFGWMRYEYRAGNEANINRVNYFTRRRESFIGATFSMRFTFRSDPEDLTLVSLIPYIQFPLSEFNFREYNQTLNPYDYQTVGVDLMDRPTNFGIALSVDLNLLEAIK